MTHNTREWEAEFDKLVTKKVALPIQYGGKTTTMMSESLNLEDIKNFIHHQLQKAREEERERIANDLISYQHESGNSHIDIEWFVETLFTQHNSELDQPNK